MKKLLIALMCCPLLIIAQETTGIKWAVGLNWQEIVAKAKAENKFIFVDAYATWCEPCKAMDKNVYPEGRVGAEINAEFISAKIQMDQTDKDNEQTKKWYEVAHKMNEQYGIEAYPTFLFFSPDGKLVLKAFGYRDVSGFIELAKDALTDPEARYKRSIEKFNKGELDFASMPDLAREALNKKDRQSALNIAIQFKEKYLDKLSNEEAFVIQNLSFIADFSEELVKSNDRYFQLFYTRPVLADSILNCARSRDVVEGIIRKEEIFEKIYMDGKPFTLSKPNWKVYKNSIKKKYGKSYINKFFPDEQIIFYQMAEDWGNYIKYVNVKIKKFSPQFNGKTFGPVFGDAFALNWFAWTLFKYCNNKDLLRKALPWTELAIKLNNIPNNGDCIDTKANLLYKMKEVKEAIELEEVAVFRSNSNKGIVENLKKMKAGLPTWPIKQ